VIVLEIKKFATDEIEERFVDTLDDMLTEMRFLEEEDDMVYVRATLLSKDHTASAILKEVEDLSKL